MGNCSDCWELSSFSEGERLSPKLAVVNREKIVGNSEPEKFHRWDFSFPEIENFDRKAVGRIAKNLQILDLR